MLFLVQAEAGPEIHDELPWKGLQAKGDWQHTQPILATMTPPTRLGSATNADAWAPTKTDMP